MSADGEIMNHPLSRPNLHSYLRTHLHGAAGGIDLFRRSAKSQHDLGVRVALSDLHDQVVGERAELAEIAIAVGSSPDGFLSHVARWATRLGQLKPNGNLFRRSAMADLIELEALRTAVAGKTAGWEALISIADQVPQLDPVRLEELAAQSREQLERLGELHTLVASRSLTAD